MPETMSASKALGRDILGSLNYSLLIFLKQGKRYFKPIAPAPITTAEFPSTAFSQDFCIFKSVQRWRSFPSNSSAPFIGELSEKNQLPKSMNRNQFQKDHLGLLSCSCDQFLQPLL